MTSTPQRDADDAAHSSAANGALAEAELEKIAAPVVVDEPERAISPFLPVAVASALFMDLLDTAALGSALPTLAREFNAEPGQLKLALTAYLLTMAVLVPASGWLADRWGARRVFVKAMRIYLLGSLCCGLSDTVGELVASRVLQGIGGAMMTPVGRMIVVASTPRARLVQAMNAFTIPAVIGPLLGPPLAGVLLEYASWRWIFFINIPIGLAGMVAVLYLVPRLRHPHPGRFDRRGFAYSAIAITGVVALAETIGLQLLPVWTQIALAIVATVAVMVYVRHARHTYRPLIDLSLLRKSTYQVSMIGSVLMRLSLGGLPFLLPLLLQSALGWSPLMAGTVMASMMVGSILARFGGTWMLRVMGFRKALMLTAAITAVLTMAPTLFRMDTPVALIAALLLVTGFFRAAHFVGATSLAYAEIGPGEVNRASTLANVLQPIALSLGLSVAGLGLHLSAADGNSLQAGDFLLPFAAIGLLSLLAVPVYARLDPAAGELMRGRT